LLRFDYSSASIPPDAAAFTIHFRRDTSPKEGPKTIAWEMDNDARYQASFSYSRSSHLRFAD